MAEIWKRPEELEKKRLMDAFDDNLVFAFVRSALEMMDNKRHQTYDAKARLQRDYYMLSRLMVLNFGAYTPTSILCGAVEDIADDKLPKGWELPKMQDTVSMKFHSTSELPILDIIEKYGLNVKKNKMSCPFHAESKPSLVIYPETNSFFCFGCRLGGDVLTFIKLMETLKDE